MMEKYQENNVNRDMFYEEQKREKIKAAQEEVRKAEEEKKAMEKLKDVSEEYPIDMEPEPEPDQDLNQNLNLNLNPWKIQYLKRDPK